LAGDAPSFALHLVRIDLIFLLLTFALESFALAFMVVLVNRVTE